MTGRQGASINHYSMVEGLGERFEKAVARFDRANAEDPNRERVDGVETPKGACLRSPDE